MNQTVKEIGKKVVALLPTKMWLSYRFKQKMGYPMDWKNPETYNQKLQWLKVYDKNPLYTVLVDKYEVKRYVAEKIGEEYLGFLRKGSFIHKCFCKIKIHSCVFLYM